jgi:hypothetical protein
VRPESTGLAHAPQPALVVGEHAEGLEHLPVLAVMGDVAALDQLVDGDTHLGNRGFERFTSAPRSRR